MPKRAGPAPAGRPPAAAAILAAAVAASASLAPAAEPDLYVSPTIWLADLSGDGHTGRGSASQQFDVDQTFGLDAGQAVPSLEAFIRFGKSRFIVGWNRGAYDGGDRLDSTLVYKGTTFPAGNRLRSEFDYDRRRLLYARPFFDGKTTAAGFVFGLDSYRIDASVAMSGVGTREVDLDARVPVLGASVTVSPRPSLRIYGEAVGMSITRGGVDSKVLEAYAVLEYSFIGDFVALSAGYRTAAVEGEDEDRARFDLRQKGFFTGFVIRL